MLHLELPLSILLPVADMVNPSRDAFPLILHPVSKSCLTHHSEQLPLVKGDMSLEITLSSLHGVLCYHAVSSVKQGFVQAV